MFTSLLRRDYSRALLLSVAMLLPAGEAAAESWGSYTQNRTGYDDQIREIRYRREQQERERAAANREFISRPRDNSADVYRRQQEREMREEWAADQQRMRARAARAVAVAAEEEARTRALLKLYDAANAGDADALMATAAVDVSLNHDGAVARFLGVKGPRRAEALWAAIAYIRKQNARAGSDLELRLRLALEELALRGDVRAMRERASLSSIEDDAYVSLSYSTKAALAGDRESQLQVVRIFASGKVNSVPAPAEKVYAWCREAGEAGDVGGQVSYARALFWGSGIEQNLPEAMAWFKKAIAADTKKLTSEEDSLRVQAMNLAGTMLLMGNGVPEDKAAGFALMEQAAGRQSDVAALNVANCYLSGDGVEKNVGEAVRWFETAAERGNADAARAVATLYFSPELPIYDEAAGLRWIQRFSKRDPRAMIAYGEFVHDGRYGVKRDAEKAKWFFETALEKYPDDPYVLNAVGVMTLKGLHAFTADPVRGIGLLKQAYERGSAISARSLQKIYMKGLGVAVDAAEAGRWKALADAADAPVIPMD